MLKQWVQPPNNENRLPSGIVFFIRVPSDKFYFDFLLLRFFLEILGESIGIQFSAISVIQFNKGFNQICFFLNFIISVFHWNIRGALIQNPP